MIQRLFISLFFVVNFSFAQTLENTEILTLDEYLGFIKEFHPLVKQANLEVSQAQAGILAARGGFDPKIEIDYEKKEFKSTDYFDILNGTFKIPTWYGVEVKAGFEQADGVFLNPERTYPASGLATLGIAVPIGQGLLINKRMADLRKAKIYQQLSIAERDLNVINILYDAIVAYFNWYQNQLEYDLYSTFLTNANIRLDGIRNLIKEGDRPPIDSLEAGIIAKDRALGLEQSRIKLQKSSLELSNFLWLENGIPLELQDNIFPELELETNIATILQTNGLLMSDVDIENHPKIRALRNKIEVLKVEKQFAGDLLKPRLDLNYNYLSESVNVRDFNVVNYKYGLQFSVPIFLRKERGNFKIAKFRLQDATLDLDFENLALKNKIDYQMQEINSLDVQLRIMQELADDYQKLLTAEERLFFFGESSIFILNSRENSLLSSNLKLIKTKLDFCFSHAALYNVLARNL
jgi:outer membrane protein TolC